MSSRKTEPPFIQSRVFGLTPKEQAKALENGNLAIQFLKDALKDPKTLTRDTLQVCCESLVDVHIIASESVEYIQTLAPHASVIEEALVRSRTQKEQRKSRQGGENRRGSSSGRRPRRK